MKKMGINRAWIGFDDYEDALRKKEFVKYLKESFYLIAPYDSYHSIQKKDDKNSGKTILEILNSNGDSIKNARNSLQVWTKTK